jgi:hypothetical protein
MTRDEMLREAHCERGGHNSVLRTHRLLNKNFPGHNISQAQVTSFKEQCVICQKTEDYIKSQLLPVVRNLRTTNPDKVMGIDYPSVVLDKYGNVGCYVRQFFKLTYIFPVPAHDSEYAAIAIFTACVLYDAFGTLMSDPGSDLMSEAVAQVNKWFGIHHRVSLVDSHESNGVEGANKQIIRHLTKLFMTEKIKNTWSAPQNVGWCMFIMNTYDTTETGVSAYDLTFETVTDQRFVFSIETLNHAQSHKHVRMLYDSLKSLTAASAQFQNALNEKRAGTPAPQNAYQNGNLVLFRLPRDKPRPHKLHPIYLGPYSIILQKKNDVEVRHLASGKISTYYVEDLKMIIGNADTAYKLDILD